MFGRNKKKTKQPEFAMPNMNNFGLTDADMNDKDLLREYQMLMKEVGGTAPSKNNMSLEEELGALGNFNMDEKNLLETLNDSVNRSTNLTNKTNINVDNIDNIDNIEIDDDDLNDPDLLKELNLITGGKGDKILNSTGNDGNTDIPELKDIMGGENLEEEILDPKVAQPNFKQKKISPTQLNNTSGPIPNINNIGNIKNIYNENIEVDDSESNKLLQSMGINIGGNQLPPKPNRVQSAVSQSNTSGISFEEKMKCQDLTRLEKYIEEEQKLASAKLKQRDIEGAKKAMDNMKALKERFAQLGLEKKKQTPANKGNNIQKTQQQLMNNNGNEEKDDEEDEEVDETKINGKMKVNGANLGLNADFDIDFGNIDDVEIDVDDEDLDEYEEELLKTMDKAPTNEQSTLSKQPQQSQKPQQPEISFPEIPVINNRNNINNNMGSMNNMKNMNNNMGSMNNMNNMNNNMGSINNMNNMNRMNNNMGNMNNMNNMNRMNNNMGNINNMNNMNNMNRMNNNMGNMNNNNIGRMNNMNNINNNMNNNMGRMNNMNNQMNNIDNGNYDDSISMNNSIISYDISFDEANNTIIKDNVNNEPSSSQLQKPKPQMQPPQKEPSYENMSKGELLKMLHERENEYKTNAVVLNRQGKKPEAYTSLNKYKSIKAAIDVVNLTGKLPTNFEVPESLTKSSSKSNLNGSSHSLNSSRNNSLNSLKASQLPKLPQGQNQSAANSRSSSNQSLNQAPAKRHPNSPFSLPNVRGTGKQFKNETQAEKFYNEIESKINKQIEKCNAAVKIYYSRQNKQEALRLHKMKKLLNESVESIKILKSNVNTLGDMEIPNFLYENVDYIIENLHEDIGMSEMEIEIVKATGLYSREVKSGLFNSYVVCNSHYPTDENEEVFQTKVVSNTNNPEFNYKKRIKIVRGKPLLRFIERKKLVFEIFHDKGFLRKNIPLGKANIKIDQLATKSELNFSVNLCDSNNPRKTLDGKLDINIRLHMPLAEHEFVIKTEKWAILDMTAVPKNVSSQNKPPQQQPQSQLQANKPLPSIQIPQKSPSAPARGSSTISGNNSQSLKSPASSTPTNQTSLSPQHLSANIRPGSVKSTPNSPAVSAKSPSLSANSPVQKSPVSASASKANEELEQLIEQFEDPANMVSNNVLENEQKILQQQVVEAKLKKLPTYNELNDKLQAITIQIQMLVTKIDSGILSLEDYVKQLNEAIVNTKKMAATFKKYGRIDLAKKALIRIKIMEKELEEGDEEEE